MLLLWLLVLWTLGLRPRPLVPFVRVSAVEGVVVVVDDDDVAARAAAAAAGLSICGKGCEEVYSRLIRPSRGECRMYPTSVAALDGARKLRVDSTSSRSLSMAVEAVVGFGV